MAANNQGNNWISQVLAWLETHGGYNTSLIEGSVQADNLLGTDGNDILNGGGGDDQLDGGVGLFDVADYSSLSKRLVVDLEAGMAKGDGTDTLINIEGVIGGSGNDQIKGSTGDNLLEGGRGNDHLFGQGGNDIIYAGSGNDKVVAGSGDDLIDGGTGNDNISAGDGDNEVYGGAGNDRIVTGAGTDLIFGGEGNDQLRSGDGDDEIYGDAGKDVIFAGAGDDVIDGGAGADNMAGGIGNDTYYVDGLKDLVREKAGEGDHDTVVAGFSYSLGRLTNVEDLTLIGDQDINGAGNNLANWLIGNSGNNQLDGWGGDDVLIGGEGADTLTGGVGSDTFVFDSLEGVDTITDFASGEDKLQLDSTVFSALVGGVTVDNLAFGSGAADDTDFLVYDSSSGVLFYDADASGAGEAVQIALLGVGATVAVTDFIVS